MPACTHQTVACRRSRLTARTLAVPPPADALSGWEGCPAEDGSLPIDFAKRLGTAGVLERLLATRQYEAAASKAAAAGGEGGKPGLRQRSRVLCDSASSSRHDSSSLEYKGTDAGACWAG